MLHAAKTPSGLALLASLLCFSLLGFASEQEGSSPSPEKEAEPVSISAPQAPASPSRLETESSTLLSTIVKEAPGLLDSLSEKDRRAALSAFVSSLGLGVELLAEPAKVEAAPRHPLPEQGCLPGVSISSNRIFYVRLNRLDKASASALKEEVEGAFRMARRPAGLVLDLRDCEGSDPEDAASALDALSLKEPSGAPLDLRSAVLTGPRCSGSPELLAALLERSRKGLLVGAPSAGLPFKTKPVQAGQLKLSIPEIPPAFASFRQAPLKPAIEVQPYPAIDYAKLRSTIRSEDSDQCLSRAVDLLVALDSIKRKWKKTGN